MRPSLTRSIEAGAAEAGGKAVALAVGSPVMEPFWKTKSLEQMTTQEWESLCDGCGRCCLHKLRHEATNELSFTNVACRLLDLESCQCSDYLRRQRRVPDCVSLTPQALRDIDWLPPSCAYVRLRDGKDLSWWHPLVSGSADTVHQAGVSVRGRAISERRAGALEDHVTDWPGKPPRGRRGKADGTAAPSVKPMIRHTTRHEKKESG